MLQGLGHFQPHELSTSTVCMPLSSRPQHVAAYPCHRTATLLEDNLEKALATASSSDGPKLVRPDCKVFKLRSSISMNNMVLVPSSLYACRICCPCWTRLFQMLFDADGKIKKYVGAEHLSCVRCRPSTTSEDNTKDILQDFAQVRLKVYEKWRAWRA